MVCIVHVVTAVEGPKIWYEIFLNDLENRQYTYKATHQKVGIIGPMVREIHFLDITVPEQNLPDLLADLAPYTYNTTQDKGSMKIFLKKMAWFSKKLLSLFGGVKLKEIPHAEESGLIRRRALNIQPLFSFEDKVCYDGGLVLPLKDGGGELL